MALLSCFGRPGAEHPPLLTAAHPLGNLKVAGLVTLLPLCGCAETAPLVRRTWWVSPPQPSSDAAGVTCHPRVGGPSFLRAQVTICTSSLPDPSPASPTRGTRAGQLGRREGKERRHRHPPQERLPGTGGAGGGSAPPPAPRLPRPLTLSHRSHRAVSCSSRASMPGPLPPVRQAARSPFRRAGRGGGGAEGSGYGACGVPGRSDELRPRARLPERTRPPGRAGGHAAGGRRRGRGAGDPGQGGGEGAAETWHLRNVHVIPGRSPGHPHSHNSC